METHQISAEMKMKLFDSRPRRYLIRNKLIEFFDSERIQPGSKLPSEKDLSQMLSVSRLSLREALHILEEERIVRAEHGSGWFLMSRTEHLEPDIARLHSVTEMFTSYGLELTTRVLSLKTVTLNKGREKLNLKPQDKVVAIERIRSLKQEPYIYSIDYIPRSALSKELTREMVEGSLLKILEEEFDIVLEYSLAKIQVVEREQFESREESLQSISSWLLLEQVNFNQNGEPIIYSRDYNRSDKLQFFVRRYRSLSHEAVEPSILNQPHGEA